MKKLMSWLLVFAMLLSFVPAGAVAAEGTYFVAGTSSLCGSNWSNNDPNNQMSLNADGLYEKTFENVPAGNHQFKVTDGTWDNCWPGDNYNLSTTELQNVTITFNADTKEIAVSLSEATGGELPEQPPVTEAFYTVAGTEGLCGSGWNPADESNKMTLNAETGLYEKYFVNVPTGEHKFKVTDGSWSNCWGNGDDGDGNTVTFFDVANLAPASADSTRTLTFTLNLNTFTENASGLSVTETVNFTATIRCTQID